MLYDVVRQLVPTPEIIFAAWSQSLDYNAGTASHSVAAMTAVCEMFGMQVGDWMKKPPGAPSDDDPEMQVAAPSRDDFSSSADFAEASNAHASRPAGNEDEVFIPLVGRRGMREGEVSNMVDYMARLRRVVSSYRHRCVQGGNSSIVMCNPEEVIDRIMQGAKLLGDAAALGISPTDPKYMPLHSSCVLSSAVQVSVMHNTESLASWMKDKPSDAEVHPQMGTMPAYEFSCKQRKGAQVWDAAWLERPAVLNWMCIARSIVNQNTTCKIFDLPQNGLRDLLFLLSTGDNKRRCTEEPRVPGHMCPNFAFTQAGQPAAIDARGIEIRMRGVGDVRNRDAPSAPPGTEAELPRHPYSGVADSKMQRGLDFALNSGRLPAMSVHFSNNVTDSPPLRILPGEGDKKSVQLNTAAALDHTKMVAEACLRCSIHPGMKNHQERFCGDAAGPKGLEHPRDAGGGSEPESGAITKVSYSIDIFGISITLDALSRYYDPYAERYYAMMREEYGDLDIDFSLDSRVHVSLKYVGLKEEPDRRFLSTLVRTDRNTVFDSIEVHTPVKVSEYEELHSMVSMMVGHHASDEEVHRFQCAREGARAMSSVRGDLLSLATWIRHSATVLMERGMVESREDVVMASVADDPYLLRARVAEAASIEINNAVDADYRMEAAERPVAGDNNLSSDELAAAKKQRRQEIRMKLYREIKLDSHLEHLREYGPLRITQPLKKRTYQNSKPPPAQADEAVVDMIVFSEADDFQTDVDLLGMHLGRKTNKRQCSGDGLHFQGREDVRTRC